jgi:hypothetical protein
MHVHAHYSQQMASLGVGQPSTKEVAARRSADVRKKLSITAGALNEAGDEITGVDERADERQQEQQQSQRRREPNEDVFGRFFSARV